MSSFDFVNELNKIAKNVQDAAAPKKDVKKMTYNELVATLKAQGKMK